MSDSANAKMTKEYIAQPFVSLSEPKGAIISTITTINPVAEEKIQSYEIMTEKEVKEHLEASHTAICCI